MDWGSTAVLVGVLSPLVGAPLTAITLYLRAIREHQTTASAEVMHRIENLERSVRDLSRAIAEIERDYTTREEWLRESMHARQQLERLAEAMAKVQAELEDGRGLAAELARATGAIVGMTKAVYHGEHGDHGEEKR